MNATVLSIWVAFRSGALTGAVDLTQDNSLVTNDCGVTFMAVQGVGVRRTFPTDCRHCGGRIFVHTNGYGDWVLFDELG